MFSFFMLGELEMVYILKLILVVDGPADTTAAVKNPRIVGEGCLGPTLDLLAQCKDNSVENWQVTYS